MKKSILISLLIAAMGVMMLNGCQIKSSCEGCEGGMQGYLQILDEPYKTDSRFYKEGVKITAHFYVNKNHEGPVYYITGEVPKRLSPNDLVSVKLSSVYPEDGGIIHEDLSVWIYKLNCFCDWNE